MKKSTEYFLVRMFEAIFIIMDVITLAVSIWSQDTTVMAISAVICIGITMLFMSIHTLAENLKDSIELDKEIRRNRYYSLQKD